MTGVYDYSFLLYHYRTALCISEQSLFNDSSISCLFLIGYTIGI